MIEADRKEVFRYLGYRGREPKAEVAREIERCMAELQESVEPRSVYRFFPLERLSEGHFCIEGMEIESRALARNLKGCTEVCLMAATLGMGPDRLAARATAVGKMSRTVIFQAAAAAMIEQYCDTVNEHIRTEAAARGLFCRPRFSPGYGDFSLLHQTELLRILKVQQSIGVALTESLLMLPSKSVTALIGISEQDNGCILQGCECCENAGCAFRREAYGAGGKG